MLIEFAARLHTGRWTDTQAKAGACPLLPAEVRPFALEDIHEWLLRETSSIPSGEFASLFACATVCLILYSNLQSDHTKFLYFVPFCFFRRRTAVACSSSIDRLQLVCFVKGNSLFPFFRGCPSPLSATPTFPHTVGNHPRQAEPA